MSELSLTLSPHGGGYRPGETIECEVRWDFEEQPEAIIVRLVWHTRGLGSEDVGIGATHRQEEPSRRGEARVSLIAPAFPYSFYGKLISLEWEVEAHPEGLSRRSRRSASCAIVIAPGGEELLTEGGGTS